MVIRFATTRLAAYEVFADLAGSERDIVLNRVVEIFSPAVVKHLPPAFHDVESIQAAERWFDQMIAEGQMFAVYENRSKTLVGWLFVYVDDEKLAHIGYLLGEDYWGKGLASELLSGLIEFAKQQAGWSGLMGGVDRANSISAHLLRKLGFVEQADQDGSVTYYRYDFS